MLFARNVPTAPGDLEPSSYVRDKTSPDQWLPQASCEDRVARRTSAFGFCLLGAHGSLVGCMNSHFVLCCMSDPFSPVHGCTCRNRDGVMLL